jgi:hypothetical protein
LAFEWREAFGREKDCWRERIVEGKMNCWRKNARGRLLKKGNEWLKGNCLRKCCWREKNCWRRIAKGDLLASLRAEILRKLKRTWYSASLSTETKKSKERTWGSSSLGAKTLREIILKKN